MPKISLVVCLYKEHDLLERLLKHSEGCYDDLVVVHDGEEEADLAEDRRSKGGEQPNQKSAINQPPFPRYEEGWKSPEQLSLKEPDAPPFEIARDYAELPKDAVIPSGYRFKTEIPQPGSIHELVVRHGGRFYEGPRCFQQEPHWPFAWWAAKHDWILRLDADEFPSFNLVKWIRSFKLKEIDAIQSQGFVCIWPQWTGTKQICRDAPPGRLFLFNKREVHFFGMVEHTPETLGCVKPLELVLEHQPKRKSFGLRNLLFRAQAYRWRKVIGRSLLLPPQALPRWNYSLTCWPPGWEYKIHHPFACMIKSFSINLWRDAFSLTKRGIFPHPSLVLGTATHQALVALQIQIEKNRV
jgi:hypothetical protein